MDLDRTQVQSLADRVKSQDLSMRRTQPPAKVPGYEPERLLGEGAYGEVWVATERNTGRKVAVKFYTHRGGLDWSLLKREVEKLAFLSADRYVVQLIEVGWESDPPYYVMEYLDRGSLEERLNEQGALGVEEAIGLFREVATGLMHAHGKGVLHCDLKPANVLLDQDSRPRLCDFGQARLSDEQTPSLGTLFYMAPEQAELKKAVPDARWDVYALGALLHCMLTGEPPYRGDENIRRIEAATTLEDRLSVYRQVIESSPKPTEHRKAPGVDRRLAEIIDGCLAPRPERRYSNVQAVLNDLDLWQRRKARRPVLMLATLLPLLVILVGGYFAYDGFRRAMNLSEAAIMTRTRGSHELAATYAAPAVAEKIHIRWVRLSDAAAYLSNVDDPPDGQKPGGQIMDQTQLAFQRNCQNAFQEMLHGDEPKPTEHALDVLKKAMQWAKDELRAVNYKDHPQADEKIEEHLRNEPSFLKGYAQHVIHRAAKSGDPTKEGDRKGEARRIDEIIDRWVTIQEWLHRVHTVRNQDLPTTSWLIMNDRGDQIARDPIDVDTVFENWGWREYFHGDDAAGDLEDRTSRSQRPTKHPHLTRRPFKSRATNQPMVAFSVPIQMRIQDKQGRERTLVAGVLAMTVEFGEFSELQHENEKMFTSLIYAPPAGQKGSDELRGSLLEHPFLKQLRDARQPVPGYRVSHDILRQIDELMTPLRRIEQLLQPNSPPTEEAKKEIDQLLKQRSQARILEDFHDPIAEEIQDGPDEKTRHEYQGPWLAAAYPVVMDRRPTDWVVVVQEKSDDAKAPVFNLRRQLLTQAVVALIAVLLAVAAAWAFVGLVLHGHTRSKFINAVRRRIGLTATRSTTTGTASGTGRPGKTPTSRSATK